MPRPVWEVKFVYELSVTLQFEANDWDEAWFKAKDKLFNDELDGKEPVPDNVSIEYLVEIPRKEYVQ